MSKGIIAALVAIVCLGGFLRFVMLTQVPPSLNWDEVAMGYNAYSILETGKDEFGNTLPKYFRSLDDYKRPVYVYSTVVSVAVFGLTDFAVRAPAALFGTLTILIIFFLTRELFKNDKLALIAAGILAILPWHIQFSRAAFESTMGLFLTALGVLAFMYALRRGIGWIVISQIAFGLSLYSYLGQRGVVPIVTIALFVIFFKDLRKLFKKRGKAKAAILVAIGITFLFWTSLALDMAGPQGTIRYKATNIFDNNNMKEQNDREIAYAGKQGINIPRRVYQHEGLMALDLITRGYLTHFSPDFFFYDRGQQHHHAPRMGVLYLWMLPLLVIGGYIFTRKYTSKRTAVVWVWLLATPVAASLTFQLPHALRVAEMIIPISIILSIGLVTIFEWLYSWNKKITYVAGILTALCIVFFLGRFIYQYFIHLPHERSRDWVYGREEMVDFVESRKGSYDRIIASTSLEFPHIFFLYFSKYDPQKYLDQGGTKSGSWDEEGNKYDKYEFHKFNFEEDRSEVEKILFIGQPGDFPDSVTPLKRIDYLNGEPAILIVEG